MSEKRVTHLHDRGPAGRRFVYLGPPSPVKIEAWAGRLAGVGRDGGSLAAVQVTTVAPETMEAGVHPLSADALEEIARAARSALKGVPVETHP